MDSTTAQPNELRSQPARSVLLRLFTDVRTLASQEYDLVRTEFSSQTAPLSRVVVSWVALVAAGLLALICLTMAAVAGLAIEIGLPLSALAIGVVYTLATLLLVQRFQSTIKHATGAFAHTAKQLPKPRTTTKTLDEQAADIEWTRHRIEDSLTALERKADLGQPLRDTAFGVGALGVAVANIMRENGKTRA
jgi:hypothetical protein